MRLVGRAMELSALRGSREHAATSGPIVVLLTGPSGVGKSALLAEFRAGIPAGEVWSARAVPWESDRPFGVLRQLLSTDVPADPVDAGGMLVDGAPRTYLIDDARWCDADTVRAISSAVRHHPHARLLVVLAGDTAPGPDPVLDDLLGRTADRTMTVGGLDAVAIGELAAAHGVTLRPSLTHRLLAHTGGVVREIEQLLTQVPTELWTEPDPVLPPPASVRADTVRALGSLSAETRGIIEAVAVLGSPAGLGEAVALARSTDPVRALDEAAAAGLVHSATLRGARVLTLPNPMVAAAVVESLGVAKYTAAHAEAAKLVDDPVRAVEHEAEAGLLPDAELAEKLDGLASEQAVRGAWALAAAVLIKASRLTTDARVRDERLLRGVDALVGAGDIPGAATYLAEIESLRETPSQGAVLGYLAIVRGRRTEAEGRLKRAWDLVVPDREPEVAARICQRYVLHRLAECGGTELVRWADRAIALAGTESAAIAVEARAIRGLGVAAAGSPSDAMAEFAELAERVPHGAQAQRVRMAIGWLDLVLDRVDDAVADLETAVPTDFRGGSERISLWARVWLARARFVRGDWDSALEAVREALALAEQTGITLTTPLAHWTAVQVYALRGEWKAADRILRLSGAAPQDYPIMRIPGCLARAHYAEAHADYAGVLQALAPLTQPWARGEVADSGFWPWADVYANALVVQGRYDDAETHLAEQERIAAERATPSGLARLGYARGRLLGARGLLDEAREEFDRSLRLLEDLPLPYDRARVNFAYGQTLRRAGKRREADAVMVTARELYVRLGARTYVQRCDRELKAAGIRTPRSTSASSSSLTPQEIAVGALVADGRTNREVADELFLSTKTVQYHLTHIYSKLGIRSRGALGARWSEIAEE